MPDRTLSVLIQDGQPAGTGYTVATLGEVELRIAHAPSDEGGGDAVALVVSWPGGHSLYIEVLDLLVAALALARGEEG